MCGMKERHEETINHINRLIGQLNALKERIHDDQRCREIASLTRSISSSAKGLQIRTLKGYIMHDLIDKELSEDDRDELDELLQRTEP